MTKSLPLIKPVQNDNDQHSFKPKIFLEAIDADKAAEHFQDFRVLADEKGLSDFTREETELAELSTFLAAVFELSPYLFSLAKKNPQTIQSCMQDGFEIALGECLSGLDVPSENETQLMEKLRVAKQKGALICGLADLSGVWSAAQVSFGISELADRTLQTAVNFCLQDLHIRGRINLPNPDNPAQGSGYSVIAMGKHGARELNYSSDIDIIVFIDPFAPAILDRDESVTEFVRLTKRLVKLMQERTADGYVFRTDLRLRPDPGSMPLAIPVGIALNYYESRGQNWERAALIKARVAAGDAQVGADILSELVPFIWRRYLDYAAIADVHSIKRQIQAHRDLGDMIVPGHNVKLGRGGIREIEFFVQTQQLIAGGRMPELRERRTVEMLSLLYEAGWIEADARNEMSASYVFLRDVEHRLQMIADAQTHSIPEGEADILVVARLCGFRSGAEFSSALVTHLQSVEKHYADLFSEAPALNTDQGNLSFTGDEDDPGTLETLSALGYENPKQIISIVRSWHYGRYPAMQSADARQRLTELTPALLSELAVSGARNTAIIAFDEFLKGLPAGFQLFSLLHANPQILGLLVKILGSAPRLARIITRRPHVFDGLLEPGFFQALPNQATFDEGLKRTLQLARDYEDGLDRARVFAQEQRFLIGIRALSGSMTPQQAGAAFTNLAQSMLVGIASWVQNAFEEQYGIVPKAKFCLLAMGNFGTCELTAGSDLDLVFLYKFDPEHDESNGRKSLHASQYYGRFTQRLIAALSAPTSEGVIYEMDMRLRPGGASGPIATSLRAFKKYYEDNAWTWEWLALTRARPVVGDEDFKNEVAREIDGLLNLPKVTDEISRETLKMRQLMDKERPSNSVWDIKLAKGGLIDLEFIAQWSVLTGKTAAGGTTAEALRWLRESELHNDNVTLDDVHFTYSSIVQMLRLCLDQNVPFTEGPDGLIELVLKMLDFPDLSTAEAYLTDIQRAVRTQFLELMRSTST